MSVLKTVGNLAVDSKGRVIAGSFGKTKEAASVKAKELKQSYIIGDCLDHLTKLQNR